MNRVAAKWYCIDHLNYWENAGSKAANDAAEIAKRNGAEIISFYAPKILKNRLLSISSILITGVISWCKVAVKVKRNDWVLIQHPHEFVRIANIFIDKLKRRGVHFAVLIHDLTDLRFEGIFSIKNKDNILLDKCDKIICLNDKMLSFLEEKGFNKDKMYSMEVWDYLTDNGNTMQRFRSNEIAFAGNLHNEKSAFIYKFNDLDLKLNLYGMNYTGTKETENITYLGQFKADKLPGIIKGSFGLVWDGKSLETCSGSLGTYLLYNNPHKMSLYLAAGMPVIVWEKAAVADFVRENNIGITIESIYDIGKCIAKMTDGEYFEMQQNAIKIGERIRAGYYLTKVLNQMGLPDKEKIQ